VTSTDDRPALRDDAWTADDDRKLMAVIEAKTSVAVIAHKLKRTVGAVQSHRAKLRRLARCNILEAFEPGDIGLDRSLSSTPPSRNWGAGTGGAALGDGWRATTDRDEATAGD
jgi:hypothetical protein